MPPANSGASISLTIRCRWTARAAKFIDKKGEGIHHLAFESDSINDELEHLNNEGIELIHQQPKDGADNKEIAFLHPKSTGGVLWELCQEKKA